MLFSSRTRSSPPSTLSCRALEVDESRCPCAGFDSFHTRHLGCKCTQTRICQWGREALEGPLVSLRPPLGGVERTPELDGTKGHPKKGTIVLLSRRGVGLKLKQMSPLSSLHTPTPDTKLLPDLCEECGGNRKGSLHILSGQRRSFRIVLLECTGRDRIERICALCGGWGH